LINCRELTRIAFVIFNVRLEINYALALSHNALNVVHISVTQNALLLLVAFLAQLCKLHHTMRILKAQIK
jgi:hypothetical protein